MADPYAGGGTGAATLANVKGDTSDAVSNSTLADTEKTLSTWLVLKRLLTMVGRNLPLLVFSFVMVALGVVAQLYIPILIGEAIDSIVGKNVVDFVALQKTCMRMVLVIVIAALAQWIGNYGISRLSNEAVRDLRISAYHKLSHLPLSFIDAQAHGDLLARIASDAEQVGEGLLQGITQLLSGSVTIAATLVFMFSLSTPVAFAVMLITPLSVVVSTLIARASRSSFARNQTLSGDIAAYVEEYIGNQRLVSMLGYSSQAIDGFMTKNAELREVGEHAQFVSSLSNPSTRLVNNLTYAVVAVLGCLCVILGTPAKLTIGQVQSFLSYANQYMKPFNEVSSVAGQVQTAFAAARRLLVLIDAEEELQDPPDAITPHLVDLRGELEFDHVSFSYVEGVPLLEDINFHANPGQRIALVGPTGCGKTTLINLLLRFYGVQTGQISVDGVDIRRMTRAGLRACFGMVLQESWLFEGTVAENIAYGRLDATAAQIESAAKRAHVDAFIRQLPQGYDTVIGEGGDSLSQGQRQLLCIARVMLADPPILLLDEATSSIDTRTELQVQAAFDEMMLGRTSLVVAHRLSTIREADCILVMNEGHIIERGTHEELLALGGFYADLYRSQFEGWNNGKNRE